MFNLQKLRSSDKKKKVTQLLKQSFSTEQDMPSPSNKHSSENSANNIYSIFGDGLVGINADGKINFINKTACKLTGWTQEEAITRSIKDIFRLKKMSPLNKEIISYVIQSGQLFSPFLKQEIRAKDNSVINISFSISPLDNNSAILMFRQLKLNESGKIQSLPYHVNYDSLTRLLNRQALQSKIEQLHNDYADSGKTYSVLLIDIDRFKLVNDRFGQVVGDQLLQLFAERIQSLIRDDDIAGRWTGEEFLCILPETKTAIASMVAERLRESICETAFELGENNIFISTSIGVASFPLDGNSPEALFCTADATLYEAKRKGRNRVQNNQQLKNNIFSTGSQLEKALNDKRLIPYYQPIIHINAGTKVAEETLARIQEDDGEVIAAGNFIDAAVKLQLVHRVDYEIIRSTILRCCIHYAQSNLNFPHFVNISADFLRRPELVKQITDFARKAFTIYGLDDLKKKPIVIEITEQELLHNINDVQKTLAPFIDLGFELAVDDFGSGYSPLTYLSDLPISYLKFDGTLIKRVLTEARVRKIVTGIQRMAESLNLVTIAEHIEDESTLVVIQDIGVNLGQGYYFGEPTK